MIQVNPETGEYYDDGLGGYEEEPYGSPVAIDSIPPPPPLDIMDINEPTPRGYGLGGSYVPRKQYPITPIPKNPNLVEEYDPERHAMITGYGTRLMLRKPGSQDWITPGGEIASPEYVKDVQDTMKALDKGEMSENQLKAKIAEQEGKPPGSRPDAIKLSAIEFRKFMEDDLKKKADSDANEAVNKEKSFYRNTDISLMTPAQKADYDRHLASVYKSTYERSYGQGDTLLRMEAERRARAEEVKANKELNPPSQTDEQLIRTMNFDPDPKKRAEAKVIYDQKQADAVKVAGAKSLATEKGKKDVQLGLLDPETLKIEGIKFATTGKMTAMGMGGGPYIRTAIMNAAAQHLKDNGVDPATVPAMQNEFNAAAQAFTSIKKSTEQVKGFENGLIKNADYALELSKDIFRADVIPVNKVINYFKTNAGDPDIVRFGTAIYAAAMEYEKVRTAGTGITSAELSVGAQKKAEEIINKAMTHKQLEGVIEAMKQDTKNIMEGRTETLKTMDKEMRNLDSMFGNKVSILNIKNDRVIVISPDGRQGSIPSSQLDKALKQGYKRK